MKENNKSNKKELNTCQYAKKCGGCDYQGISYSEQLTQKQQTAQYLMRPLQSFRITSRPYLMHMISLLITICLMK